MPSRKPDADVWMVLRGTLEFFTHPMHSRKPDADVWMVLRGALEFFTQLHWFLHVTINLCRALLVLCCLFIINCLKMSGYPSDSIDFSALHHDPPLLPPIDFAAEDTSNMDVEANEPIERVINRRGNRMKYKNCGVLATKIFFLKDEVVDNYGDDRIPPLMTLEGTTTAVPNMQKQLSDYEIH